MAQSSLKIELLGASFTIRTNEEQSYMNALLGAYRRSVDSVVASTALTDPLKVAIVAALLLADEKGRSADPAGRGAGRPSDEEDERILVDLIARIDETLGELEDEGDAPDRADGAPRREPIA